MLSQSEAEEVASDIFTELIFKEKTMDEQDIKMKKTFDLLGEAWEKVPTWSFSRLLSEIMGAKYVGKEEIPPQEELEEKTREFINLHTRHD